MSLVGRGWGSRICRAEYKRSYVEKRLQKSAWVSLESGQISYGHTECENPKPWGRTCRYRSAGRPQDFTEGLSILRFWLVRVETSIPTLFNRYQKGHTSEIGLNQSQSKGYSRIILTKFINQPENTSWFARKFRTCQKKSQYSLKEDIKILLLGHRNGLIVIGRISRNNPQDYISDHMWRWWDITPVTVILSRWV